MKKNFTQPFVASPQTIAYLLVEVENDTFLQFTTQDGLGASYATTLSVELDNSKDASLQLAEFLHINGLELVKHRELLRETHVDFSYVDNTPGESQDTICLHITAERTSREIHAPAEALVCFLPLELFLKNLRTTGMPTGILEICAGKLLLERIMMDGAAVVRRPES